MPGTNDLAYRAHKRIFEAIEARDADLAEQKMREHLDEVARQYWQAVRHAE